MDRDWNDICIQNGCVYLFGLISHFPDMRLLCRYIWAICLFSASYSHFLIFRATGKNFYKVSQYCRGLNRMVFGHCISYFTVAQAFICCVVVFAY